MLRQNWRPRMNKLYFHLIHQYLVNCANFAFAFIIAFLDKNPKNVASFRAFCPQISNCEHWHHIAQIVFFACIVDDRYIFFKTYFKAFFGMNGFRLFSKEVKAVVL